MNQGNNGQLARIIGFAALLEIAASVALLVDPQLVLRLLLGVDGAGAAVLLGRCFGIALLGLGLACWPGGHQTVKGNATWRGLVAYNGMIALYLLFLGTAGLFTGLLLWPAIGLHAALVLLLLWGRRDG